MYATESAVNVVARSKSKSQAALRSFARKAMSDFRNRGKPLPDSFAARFPHVARALGEPGPVVINDAELGVIPFGARPAHYRYEIAGGLGAPINVGGVSVNFAKSKDPGRLRSNAEWFEAAKNGDFAALDQLYTMSGHKTSGQGWATAKAKNDAWSKYQQAKQVLGNRIPTASAPSSVSTPAINQGGGAYNTPVTQANTGGNDVLAQIQSGLQSLFGGGGGGTPTPPATPTPQDTTSPAQPKSSLPLLAIASVGLYLLSQKR
jgi:hypothetical protein